MSAREPIARTFGLLVGSLPGENRVTNSLNPVLLGSHGAINGGQPPRLALIFAIFEYGRKKQRNADGCPV